MDNALGGELPIVTRHSTSERGGRRSYLRTQLASTFIRNVAESFLARIVLIGLGIATTVLVTRILGPEGRGAYAAALALGAVGVQFGNLGLHASNTYYVAKDRSLLPALLANSLVASFAGGTIGAAAAWGVFRLRPDLAPVDSALLALALMWVPFGLAYLLTQNLLLGVQAVRSYNVIEIATKVIGLVLLILMAKWGWRSPEAVFTMGLVGVVLSVGLALRVILPQLGGALLPSLSLFRENLHYGFKAYVAALFSFVVLQSDILLVKYFLGATQTGYYSTAVTVATMLYLLPVVIGTLAFPKLAAMSDPRERWEAARKVTIATAAFVTVGAAIGAIAARSTVQLLFGAEFLPAVPALVWLLPGIALLSVHTILMNYFASIGMPSVTMYAPGLAAVLNIVLNLALLPRMGIVGASVASSAAYAALLAVSLGYLAWMKPGGNT